MNGKYCVTAQELKTIVLGQCLMLQYCQVMVDDSHSVRISDCESVGSFFTVVHYLEPPSFTVENKKMLTR